MNIRIFTLVHSIHDNYRIDIQENQHIFVFAMYNFTYLQCGGLVSAV